MKKKNILSMAALLMASAAVFTACSSDDNNVADQGAKTYTLAVQASKGDDASTRALSITTENDKNKLNATWATTENVYVKKGDIWATGSLQPQTAGETATLKGTLTGITPASSDVLTLQFPRSGERDYSGQVGTLADIAAKYDYATATVTVASVSASGNIIPTAETTTFENQQAIVKFTLIDKTDGTTSLSASQLVINDGTTDYTITPASNTSVIYAAIPGFTGQTVTLTATVGEDTYTCEKTGVSFTNGKYYEIGVKMTKQAAGPTYPVALSAVTADYLGSVVTTDGNVYATVADATAASKIAAAVIAYVSSTGHGLAIALSDESSKANMGTLLSKINNMNHTPAVSGQTWKLPKEDEWKQMFSANGGSNSSYSGLNTAITNAGGSALQASDYWVAHNTSTSNMTKMTLSGGNASFGSGSAFTSFYVRVGFAF